MTAVTKFKLLLEVHSHYACWELVDNAPMMLVPLQNVFTSVTYAEDVEKDHNFDPMEVEVKSMPFK